MKPIENATINDVLDILIVELLKTEGFDRDGNAIMPLPLDGACKNVGGEDLLQRYKGESLIMPLFYLPVVKYNGRVNGSKFFSHLGMVNPQQLESGIVVSQRVAEDSRMPYTPYDVDRDFYIFLYRRRPKLDSVGSLDTLN